MSQSFNLAGGSPGVGDYDLTRFDGKSKAPKCTIGNYRRFLPISKG